MTEARGRGVLARVYGAGAREYDELWSPVILPPALAMIDALDIEDAGRVVDVGSGTGALLAALSAAAPSAQITVIDASAEMLAYAVERRGATALRADAAALPLPSSAADAVILAYVLFHLTEPGNGAREAARALRAGGWLGTVTWKHEVPTPAAGVWERTFEDLDVPDFAAHADHRGLDSGDAIEGLLTSAGIEPERIWVERVDYTFDADDFWRLRTGFGRSHARLALVDEAKRRAVLEEVQRRLATARSDDYRFRGELVCATGRRPLHRNLGDDRR